jgi:hypothetical protein
MKQFTALVGFLGLAAGIALAQSPLAPSAVVAAASTYDTKSVTVTGTVKSLERHQGPRGPVTSYQLCDTQCVNVVQFGDAGTAVADGSTQTVTGKFRASVSRGQQTMTNVIMVGGPRMPNTQSMPSGMPKPTIEPAV